MAVSHSYLDYLKAAFNAKPAGMFVAPNWIGLGIFGLLGLLNPGFWLLGAGLEAGYLFTLANHSRFRRAIDAAKETSPDYSSRILKLRAALPPQDDLRYSDFHAKCRHSVQALPDNSALHETLASVSWLFLQLLHSQLAVSRLLNKVQKEDREEGSLEERLEAVDTRLAQQGIASDLRNTLQSTREILAERQLAQSEMEAKLGYLAAELSRLEEQVGLLHDRAHLDRNAPELDTSVQRVTSGISAATAWMSREKELLGDLGAGLDEPPPSAIFQSES